MVISKQRRKIGTTEVDTNNKGEKTSAINKQLGQ